MPLLNQLFAIFLLRGRPQDLPASPTLVWVTALAATATNYVADTLHPDFLTRLLFATSQPLLFGAAVWLVLNLRGFPARWMQTIAPLYASAAVLNVIALTVFSRFSTLDESGRLGVLILFVLTIGLWFLALITHVLRHALELGIGTSLLIALSCVMVTNLLLLVLFPAPVMN